ncbi:MAG: oligosaccharide flippase family protein [Tenericutes bacterium]|nr:oligosaccharide flippase family protein [Mycoplasmatota bacterium]
MKNKFVMGTIILLTGGFFSKFLGFVLRIIITRQIGTEGIGLYSLVMPTFGLFITIATFSYPVAISKIISARGKSSKKAIFSIIPISIILNLFTLLIIFLISKPLANIFLKDQRLYIPLLSVGFTLPFIGLSSIIKGYYWGKQRMGIYILSNIVEQIVRIIVLIFLIPKVIKVSLVLTISLIIVVNVLSETSSIIVMLLGLPKGVKITKEDLRPSKEYIKDIMNICVPSTSSKIVGSISHFLEPIVLINVLSYVGYSNNYIVTEYGIVNGYSLALLLIPQFFTMSISTSLIPELSKSYSIGDIKNCKKRLFQITGLSLMIGAFSTGIIFAVPEYFLNLIYNTNLGANYIRVLAPFFLLYFINTPLASAMQALDMSKDEMQITLLTSFVKLFLLTLLAFLKIGMYSLIISTIITLIYSTYLHIKKVKKKLS